MKRLAAALCLAATVVVLYRKVIRLWWMYDDGWLLHLAAARSWSLAFAEGNVGHRLFTPLLDASYEAMLAVAGLDPDRWYRLQLVLLIACAVAVYHALRLYARTLPALAGAFLFIAGPPACSFATQLMTMHYLEAILLGALSLIAFVHASRRESNALMVLSAVLYLCAAMAKEIAVPLPVLLLVLPERTLRVRARHLVFHLIAAIVYFAWRWMAIGTLFGGYGWTITRDEMLRVVALLPWKVILEWAGSSLEVGLIAVAIVAIGAAFAIRSRRAAIGALIAFAFALGPIVIVSKEMQPRLTLVPWLWLCALFAAGVTTLRGTARNGLIVLAAVTVLIANRQEWTGEFARSQRMSDEGRAFLALDGTSLLRAPAIPPATMVELQWLKEQHLRGTRGTGWFYDDYFLCAGGGTGRRIYEYLPAKRSVVEVTARIPDFARAYCMSIRDNVPLRAEFHHRNETLSWRFGPYDDGKWRVLFAAGVQAFDVPRQEGFKLPGVPGLALRVRYQSPEGWVTYSPEINLEFARQPELEWHR